MLQTEKDLIVNQARQQLTDAQASISSEIERLRTIVQEGASELKNADTEVEEAKMIQAALLRHSGRTLEELEKLLPSPYFTRCTILFDDERDPQTYYFGKFSFEPESIISWTTPIASVRYEEPGHISYSTPEDGQRTGILLRKDQYMIVEGKIIFLASESTEYPRELVYQEYLSTRRSGFALPEIVAQMEKAQDQVIRADHAGPFTISGPAGSGKTTLALHRVAYLAQSPETSRIYPSRQIIVFVQDTGTKDYFSHLLPELGIHNVRIATFSEWAFELLGFTGISYQTRHGQDEQERDHYEYQKLQAVRAGTAFSYRAPNWFSALEKHYAFYFNERQKQLFRQQIRDNSMDRYDLTLLLQATERRNKGFWYEQELSVRQKNGLMKREQKKLPLEYVLAVVDEFQNYLPEQLTLITGRINKKYRSVLYVGDMAQQTQFGTIKSWQEIDEQIKPERTVTLHKVYRNTRQILDYINSLGFRVEVPDGIKTGVPVRELVAGPEAERAYLQNLATHNSEKSIGILCKNSSDLETYRSLFIGQDRVHCMSIREAQGVEFDIVCLVGVSRKNFLVHDDEGNADYVRERRTVTQDLLYVALTRAISELHVIGEESLQAICSQDRIQTTWKKNV